MTPQMLAYAKQLQARGVLFIVIYLNLQATPQQIQMALAQAKAKAAGKAGPPPKAGGAPAGGGGSKNENEIINRSNISPTCCCDSEYGETDAGKRRTPETNSNDGRETNGYSESRRCKSRCC